MLDLGFKIKGGALGFLSEELVPLNIDGYKFPMECLVDIRGRKRIIKTKVPGMDGTVKEYVGMDDYHVVVHVVLQAKNFDNVYYELANIKDLWDKKEKLPILCPKTEEYGINYVVFDKFSHPETPGMESTERLTLNFLSDDVYYDFGLE